MNQTTTKFQAYFKHLARLKCRKKYQLGLCVVKNRY